MYLGIIKYSKMLNDCIYMFHIDFSFIAKLHRPQYISITFLKCANNRCHPGTDPGFEKGGGAGGSGPHYSH